MLYKLGKTEGHISIYKLKYVNYFSTFKNFLCNKLKIYWFIEVFIVFLCPKTIKYGIFKV
jgi:hypothetical protein